MYSKNIIFIMVFFGIKLHSQGFQINGALYSFETSDVIKDATISISDTSIISKSDKEGKFSITIGNGTKAFYIEIAHPDYIPIKIPLSENNQNLDLGKIYLNSNFEEQQKNFATIDLFDSDLSNSDNNEEDQQLLQANYDPFLKSAAYNWGSTFFKIRGLSNSYSKVLLNGIEVNKYSNGRPNWSNWSGLNDMLRSKEFTSYSNSNRQSYGGLIGTNQLKFAANNYRKGSKISFASTNRSYKGRVMLTHNSGEMSSGWSYSFSASFAKSNQGLIEGTNIENLGVIGSVSREISKKHRLNLTAIYTPTLRGKSSPNTNEVFNLKGRNYNAYWGEQGGEIRNSRVKKVKEPIFTLNHFWNFNDKLSFQNNILFQKGKIRNSRLEYNGRELSPFSTENNPIFIGSSRNPDPTYYQRLPSYFLREEGSEDFESAFKSDREFRNNGQLNFEELYVINRGVTSGVYALYDDVVEDTFLGVNSIWNYDFNANFNLQGKVAFHKLKSENYAEVTDLLGASSFLDVDGFSNGNKAQNNLLTPNRIVKEGDKFKYNYELNAYSLNGFLQANISISKWETFISTFLKKNNYQRKGLFENGNYTGNKSLGKSEVVNKTGYGFKLGVTRPITNKLFFSASINNLFTPPNIQQSFSNPRQNNDLVINLKNESQLALDGTLNYQFGSILARLSGYYIKRNDITNISFFFTENIASLDRNESSAFIQEITTGINTLNTGVEFGIEIEATNTLTINMGASYGKHIYTNNPQLYITSDSFDAPLFLEESKLKNYRLANGPQQAYGLGFSYRDPKYWWFSTQLNYFSDSYIDISPFTRTNNFSTDIDGQPLLDFDTVRARELLQQEQFSPYFLWNAIGGKSWRLKRKYTVGITLGAQNILNTLYKTGGFEQTRNSNFRDLDEDQSRNNPLFGNRYWLGLGTTYYLNTYLRF